MGPHHSDLASRYILILIYLFIFGPTTWHVGSLFLDQESNLCPQHWKHGVLTTGPPRNSRKSLHSARNPLHPFPMPLTSLLLGNNILKLTWHLPVQFCIVFYLGIYSFTIYRTTLCIKHFYMGNLTLYTSIQGMLQARTLEWVAISFSNAGK